MIHDVAVVGAGAAGAAAAVLAAGEGLQTVLFEQNRPAGKAPRCHDWLSEPAAAILDELGVSRQGLLGKPFGGAVLIAADLRRQAETGAPDPPAFPIDYTELVRRLRQQAADRGAACAFGLRVDRVEAREELVTLSVAGGDVVRARFVLVADGAGGARHGDDAAWIAEARITAGPAASDQRMRWVLGLHAGRTLACWWFDKSEILIRLHAQGSPDSVREQMIALISQLCKRGHLPPGIASRIGRIELRPAPAELALDADSHVDKRSLRIGDAGGFLCAACREGIYAGMWSAKLAVESIARAVKSRHPQDELRQFSTLWRTTMAEYLRPPNTDMQLLLPLVFSNDQIADRMADALWHGQNI